MKTLSCAIVLALLACLPAQAADTGRLTPPEGRPLRVAFVMTPGAWVIDFAGPWEVFQDTSLGPGQPAIQLYTVGPSHDPVRTSGNDNHGIAVTPDYSYADAPEPDLVVIGAQTGSKDFVSLSAWLQKLHSDQRVIMSVCTGAFRVADAGLLDGKQATTHHDFFDQFASQFPKVQLVRTSRYVQSDPILYTAGGLTSGIDLALHVVAEYYGEARAQKTADFMEYQGTAWKTNARAAAPSGN